MLKVKIALIPEGPLFPNDQIRYGKYTSDRNRINVNYITPTMVDGPRYSILITHEKFEEIVRENALQSWLGLIVATIKKNTTDAIIELILSDIYEWEYFGFSTQDPLLASWYALSNIIRAVADSGRIPGLIHHPLPELTMKPVPTRRMTRGDFSVKDILSGNLPVPDLGGLQYTQDDEEEDDDDDLDDDYGDDDDGYDHDLDIGAEDYDSRRIRQLVRMMERDEPPRRKFKPSRVLVHAKNAKRDLNRHGVIIANSRDDIDRDRKMIKAFLKEFIPGSQYWKKELRRTLAQRWIRMYCVSKKTHRELKKEFQHAKRTKKVETILDVTRGLFTTPLDSWDDPSR